MVELFVLKQQTRKEIYKEEEKKAELKQFSELGIQRHFIRAREEQAEEEMLAELMRQQQEDEE